MKETELAASVIAWLEARDWDVYQEVQLSGYGGRADIVAVLDSKWVWVIECKMSLGLEVIGQAMMWQAHYRSVAVPAPRRWTRASQVGRAVAVQYARVGVLAVSRGGSIYEDSPAPLMRQHHAAAVRIRERLDPLQKVLVPAGSNAGGYLTPYRYAIMQVREYVEAHPGCTLQQIMDELGKMHYASETGAKQTLRLRLEQKHNGW